MVEKDDPYKGLPLKNGNLNITGKEISIAIVCERRFLDSYSIIPGGRAPSETFDKSIF